MILAGRRINTGMSKFIAEQAMKLLMQLGRSARDLRMAILGLTFKENVPDLRNSRVPDIIRELEDYGITVLVHAGRPNGVLLDVRSAQIPPHIRYWRL